MLEHLELEEGLEPYPVDICGSVPWPNIHTHPGSNEPLRLAQPAPVFPFSAPQVEGHQEPGPRGTARGSQTQVFGRALRGSWDL